MLHNDQQNIWHDVHISYDGQHTHQAYTARSVHGGLLSQTAFTSLLQSSNMVHLLHITTSLDKILPSGELLPSGGCLVGSIYCTSLHQSPHGLRAHNLGSFIYRHEVERSLKSKGITDRSIHPLIIEVTVPPGIPRSCSGVDYLRLGKAHLLAFQQLEHKMPANDRASLQLRLVKNVAEARKFLRLCKEYIEGAQVPEETYFAELTRAVPYLPVLGYLYFEAIAEYLMLFSKDRLSLELATQGELNCWTYKEFVFRACPGLLKRFDLGTFNPSHLALLLVASELNAEHRLHIDTTDFIHSVQKRLSHLILARLFEHGQSDRVLNISRCSFAALAELAPHLLGHAVDREVRRVGEYGSFHYHFDTYKAEQVWRYWCDANVIFPFNGILPKGEVGLNPLHSGVTHKIYLGKPRWIDNVLYVDKGEPLPLKIVPRLLNPKHAFMGITQPKMAVT